MVSQKKCGKCQRTLPRDHFGPNKSRKDGLDHLCDDCRRDSNRKYKSNNRSKVNEYARKYRNANLETSKARAKAWKAANPDKVKDAHLKTTYGISLDEYNEMFAAQDGRCAICSIHQQDLKRSLCVDHNHGSGSVRSLLCHACNKAIGLLLDDADLCRSAAAYIDRHGGKP